MLFHVQLKYSVQDIYLIYNTKFAGIYFKSGGIKEVYIGVFVFLHIFTNSTTHMHSTHHDTY